MNLTLGFSPCPNDTFIFYALLNNKIASGGFLFLPVIEDVESLNRRALNHDLDITKLSFAAYPQVVSIYQLLDSGSALGNNCGPLLISKRNISQEDIANCTVAIPGEHTTANFLFTRFFPERHSVKPMLFSKIEDALLNDEVDVGVIIHENRFTYQKRGLKKIADLGELWETETRLPIPLGGIAAKKSLGIETISAVEQLISESIQYAFQHLDETIPFVKKYSQSMEEEVMWQHIRLYVNDFTISLGEKGKAAVEKFLQVSHSSFH